MSKEIPVRIGGQERLPGGSLVRASFQYNKHERRAKIKWLDSTPKHEAAHAVVSEVTGTPTLEMSVIKDGDVNGYVKTAGFTPLGAAASFGGGHGGAGWDRFLVESQGYNADAMGAAANAIAEGAQDEQDEVARMIQDQRFASGHEIREAIKDGREGRPVMIWIKDRLGNTRKEFRRVKGDSFFVQEMEQDVEYDVAA
jgi:hypothetical protein